MPYTIIESSAWATTIDTPTTGDTHLQNRTAFQAVGNRLKYIKDRIDAGFERPIRLMTSAAMVALVGMANNDQVYATDTQRLYYWDSATSAAVNAPYVLAGTSGPPGRWVAFGPLGTGLGGVPYMDASSRIAGTIPNYGVRDIQTVFNPGGTDTATGPAGAYMDITGLSVTLATVKSGDRLECDANFMIALTSGTGQVSGKLVYYDGTSDVDVTGSEMIMNQTAAVVPFSIKGFHSIPADKTSVTVRLQLRSTGPTTVTVDMSGAVGQNGLIVKCLVP